MYKAKLALSEHSAVLDKAKAALDKTKLEHSALERAALELALTDLVILQQRIAAITLGSAIVPSSKSLSGQQKKSKTVSVDAAPDSTPLMNADIVATLDEFLARTNVAPLSQVVVAAVSGAMDTWWAHARTFVPAGGSKTFGQLLLDSVKNAKQSELAELTPVFASLLFELMRVLSVYNPSLYLYSEANLVGETPWPTFSPIGGTVAADVVASSSTGGADDESSSYVDSTERVPVIVPSWFVRQRDGTDLNTHRNVDIALFTHDASTRDATTKFNLCARRNVCTAVEMKRDVSEQAMRKALKQLKQDYSTTVATQFVGERRVMFGLIGTAAQLRICQLWSIESHFQSLVSPVLAIATASELVELLGDPAKQWSDVVQSNATFLQTIARVVLHSAGAPTIDCGLSLPQGEFSAAIGGYERIRFERVLGVSRRSIVVNAVLSRSEGPPNVKSVAFKRYGMASEAARDREVEAYEKFGGAGAGVVSAVGHIVNARGAVEAVATEPVGVALSEMCLCGAAARCAVAAALRGGPKRALASIHAAGDVFSDIHDGNIIVATNANGVIEARFVDLESVRPDGSMQHISPELKNGTNNAHEDNDRLDKIIERHDRQPTQTEPKQCQE